MAEAHTIDDILAQQMTGLDDTTVAEVETPVKSEAPMESEQKAESPSKSEQKANTEKQPEAKSDVAPDKDEYGETITATADTDDYGNPVPKTKMYTEEEVQRIVRDRLSRGSHGQQVTQQQAQQVQQATENFQADPNSADSWEVQLENFIDRTIEKRQSREQQKRWQETEMQRQAEFESKFTSGMQKYADFTKVVAGKPITDSMMLATRAMQDPAAFVYAASKNFPQELDRIARLSDPFQQATEIGKLEERMRRKPVISKAPAPPTNISGDMPEKGSAHRNIDDLIAKDAKRKLGRR